MHQRTSAEYSLLDTVQRARAALLEQTNLPPDELRERLAATMREEVELYQRRAAAANDPLLADPAATRLWLEDQVLGYGDLGPLMRMPSIQTIRIMGPHRLYVVENGHQHRLAGVRFRDDQAVRDLVKRFAALAGRVFDEAHPRVDLSLPDGSRLHAVMPPIAPQYTEVTIRRFTLLDRRLESLVPETLTVGCCRFLEAAVRARANILICGDGGTGKTTLQRMLLLGIDDPDEWLICLESTWELQLHRLIGQVQSWQSRDRGTDGGGRHQAERAARGRRAALRGDAHRGWRVPQGGVVHGAVGDGDGAPRSRDHDSRDLGGGCARALAHGGAPLAAGAQRGCAARHDPAQHQPGRRFCASCTARGWLRRWSR